MLISGPEGGFLVADSTEKLVCVRMMMMMKRLVGEMRRNV